MNAFDGGGAVHEEPEADALHAAAENVETRKAHERRPEL